MTRYESGALAPADASADALYELGIVCASGRSAPADLVSAHKWFNLAAMKGHGEAARLRREIATEMTDGEIGQAQRAARDWLKSQPQESPAARPVPRRRLIVDPRVIVIEYNAGLHPPLSLTVPYQPNRSGGGTNFFGASLAALVRLGAAKGYRIVGCNISGSNAFFVRADLCADHFVEPATAAEHYEPPRHFFSLLFAGPPAPQPDPYIAV